MIYCILYFILIFAIGETLLNFTFFPYLKKYFDIESKSGGESEKSFLGINVSIFKGLLERFLIYFALCINITQILIVYGAIKIGTRFEKNDKIKNDYFLIGNFSSILFAIVYYYIFKLLN
jgi:hypothetical protein